jgi:hypothetical protein
MRGARHTVIEAESDEKIETEAERETERNRGRENAEAVETP